jgi:hypothetical protein
MNGKIWDMVQNRTHTKQRQARFSVTCPLLLALTFKTQNKNSFQNSSEGITFFKQTWKSKALSCLCILRAPVINAR